MGKKSKTIVIIADDFNVTAQKLADIFVRSEDAKVVIVKGMHKDVAEGHWFPSLADTDTILAGEGAALLKSFPGLNAALQESYTRGDK
jgi:hypothetical protein